MFQVHDLVQYPTVLYGPVKGIVMDTFPDPDFHMMVVVRVTSKDHPLYAYRMEFVVPYDDPHLKQRKRY